LAPISPHPPAFPPDRLPEQHQRLERRYQQQQAFRQALQPLQRQRPALRSQPQQACHLGQQPGLHLRPDIRSPWQQVWPLEPQARQPQGLLPARRLQQRSRFWPARQRAHLLRLELQYL
jgi:hypothetical protein